MAPKRPAEHLAESDTTSHSPQAPPPVYSATVSALAEQGAGKSTSSAAGIDEHIIARIKKCLDRANHPTTPESEAKAALHIASKLMGQLNVSQAEILAHVPASERGSYAGQSTVTIQRADGDLTKIVKLHAYQQDVGRAMRVFFNCKFYTGSMSRGAKRIKHLFTFYGLADNTVAAAMAFETAINLIEKWCMRYKGGDRKSYVLGVASENVMAKQEAAAEARCAQDVERPAQEVQSREEEVEKQSQLDRLASLPLGDKVSGVQPASAKSYDESDENDEKKLERVHISDDEGDTFDDYPLASVNFGRTYNNWYAINHTGDGGEDWENDKENEEDENYGDDQEGIMADFDEEEGRCYIDLTLDVDEEIQSLVKPETSVVKPEASFVKPEESLVKPEESFQGGMLRSVAAGPSIKPEPSSPGHDIHPQPQLRGPPSQGSPAIKNASNEPDGPPQQIERRWESHMQLVKFRDMAQTIADNYLKDIGKSLGKGRSRQKNVSNWDAYREGIADGRKIDVKRKRIEG